MRAYTKQEVTTISTNNGKQNGGKLASLIAKDGDGGEKRRKAKEEKEQRNEIT